MLDSLFLLCTVKFPYQAMQQKVNRVIKVVHIKRIQSAQKMKPLKTLLVDGISVKVKV